MNHTIIIESYYFSIILIYLYFLSFDENYLILFLYFSGSRNVRRKSITLSPKMLSPPDLNDYAGNHSPANSITSVNSLASLLREKIQVNNVYVYTIIYVSYSVSLNNSSCISESASNHTEKENKRLQNQSICHLPFSYHRCPGMLCLFLVSSKNTRKSIL